LIRIDRKIGNLSIKTIYFSDSDEEDLMAKHVDLVGFQQSVIPRNGLKAKKIIQIDLTRNENDLFKQIGKSNRYKINRAMNKDALYYSFNQRPAEDDIHEFRDFYNEFARNKNTAQCGRFHLQTLKLINDQNGLVIAKVSDDNRQPLCYHVYAADGDRAMMLYSASHYRMSTETSQKNLIGRANRYLHWRNMIEFKKEGYKIYDFGEITNDENVNYFKRSFGGKEVTEYSGYHALTRLGKLVLLYKKMKG